ncbi:ABC transporter permease [Kitasatospora sp. NA04385]|uniref:ABC transporter permease n=1 Tax=Kitasatospora sp. NA04385 TaxID=2742135 RepID=UPI0011652ABA|nr:ABC transporter permease [Kitasatospora sp. NA04385]QDJ74278.1 ABC transporter [Kitasatospora sp.]QKW22410.1 ABC transporter permease [Kitasatospora sp. NA04385]
MNGLVADSSVLIGRHLRHLRRVPSKLIGVTLMPIAFVLVFGYLFGSAMQVPGGDYHDFIMAGVFVQMLLSGMGNTSLGIIGDLNNGLVDRFRSLPMSRGSVLLARTVSDLMLSAITCLVMSVVGFLVGWRIHTGVLSALAGFGLLLLQGFAMAWFGVLLGLWLRGAEAVNSVGFIMAMPLSFLSSAFIPLNGLPGWLSTIAEWNPVSSVASACRRLWGNPTGISSDSFPAQHPIPVAILSFAVLLVVTVPLSMRAYRRAVAR